MNQKTIVKIDKTTYFSSLLIIILLCAACIIFPKKILHIVEILQKSIVTNFDWYFMFIGLGIFILCLYFGFSTYGNIRLSDKKEDKPEFSFFSWLCMIFFSAIGSSTLLWAICEPIEYIIHPPFHYIPFSHEAINISIPYGLFHWGPIAWSFFAVSGMIVSYCFYIRKNKSLQLSNILSDTIGKKHAKGFIGKMIDILSILFTFCTFGPSLGFGIPVLTKLISNLTGLPDNDILQLIVLLIWTSIFTISVYRGLAKGIKILSDINMWLLIIFLSFVFFISDPIFILRSIVEESGTLVKYFISMSTYTDVFGGDTFAQDWTVFYWIWWIVDIPFMSIFIARVSKGRTIRELLFGIVGAGSLGTMSVFWILGNYSLKLQTKNQLDLISIYQYHGQTDTVLATMQSLPFSNIAILIMILLFFVFLATCIDSGSFTMGCMASLQMSDTQQPSKFNRATWAVTIALLGIAILRLGGGLNAIKTIVIIFGIPASIILILLLVSFFKWIKMDKEILLTKK